MSTSTVVSEMCQTSQTVHDVGFETQHLVVVHFETTCEAGNRDWPLEIIQFSARAIDLGPPANIRETAVFNKFVRPEHRTTLTHHCIRETGVQQADVDSADTFSVVHEEFKLWVLSMYPKLANVAIVCATFKEIWQKLQYQCLLSQILVDPLFRQYIDVNARLYYAKGLRMPEDPDKSYLQQIAEHFNTYPVGGTIDGNQRCLALTQVVMLLLQKGFILKPNGQLTCMLSARKVPTSNREILTWRDDPNTAFRVWRSALPLAHFGLGFSYNSIQHGLCRGCNFTFFYCGDRIRQNGHPQPCPYLYMDLPDAIVFARVANLY